MNLCRTSRKHPDKSVYHSYHNRRYDWNKHPMLPPGTRAVMYQALDNRISWGPRGLDAWYCGPVFDHYHNMKFFFPEIKSYHTSALFDLFPQHCLVPTLTDKEHNETVAKEWIESIQHLKNKPKKNNQRNIKSSPHHQQWRNVAANRG